MTIAGADRIAELYEQLARRRFRDAARLLEEAFADPERAAAGLGEMAAAVEDAAAVITVVARTCDALTDVREQMDGQAAALVTLAGGLEEAADLGRR
jgi:hypothetical protein